MSVYGPCMRVYGEHGSERLRVSDQHAAYPKWNT